MRAQTNRRVLMTRGVLAARRIVTAPSSAADLCDSWHALMLDEAMDHLVGEQVGTTTRVRDNGRTVLTRLWTDIPIADGLFERDPIGRAAQAIILCTTALTLFKARREGVFPLASNTDMPTYCNRCPNK